MTEEVKKRKDPLTPEQRERQKKALSDWNKANRGKNAPVGAIKQLTTMTSMARKLEALLEPSLANIKRMVEGDPKVSPKTADMSKWVVQQVVSLKKEAQADKLKRIEIAFKTKEAKAAGLIEEKTIQEKVEEFGKPKVVGFDYNPEWDTQDTEIGEE